MFFGTIVKPGQSVQPKSEAGGEILHISQICLFQPNDAAKTYVQLSDGRNSYSICVLEKGKTECVTTDLFLATNQNMKIVTQGGKNEVHLVGYFEPEPSKDFDDEELDIPSMNKQKGHNKIKSMLNDEASSDDEGEGEVDDNEDEDFSGSDAEKDEENDDSELEDEDASNGENESDNESKEGDLSDAISEGEESEEEEEEESEEEEKTPKKSEPINNKRKQVAEKAKPQDSKKAKKNENKASGEPESEEGYLKALVDYLKTNGRTHLGTLGQKIKKPACVSDKIGKFVKDNPKVFVIENGYAALV